MKVKGEVYKTTVGTALSRPPERFRPIPQGAIPCVAPLSAETPTSAEPVAPLKGELSPKRATEGVRTALRAARRRDQGIAPETVDKVDSLE